MRRTLGITLALLLTLPSAAVAAPTEPGGTFADDDGNVHEGAIEAIALEGITLGCNPPDNDLYCPDQAVTRGQMAAFLVRALDLPASSDDLFGDDEGSVFEADINALAAAGITRGCNPPDNTNYCPDDTVTRGQMAAFLNRATGLLATASDFFTDDETSVFEADLDAIAEKGITVGCNPPDNTRYCPHDDVLRDQMADFLARALGLDPITPPPPPSDTSGELTAVFVAVRQGDAALYRGACGEMGLIDANRFRDTEILAAMDDLGSRNLEWISVSHYDSDHLGAVVDVATAPGVSVDAVYTEAAPGPRRTLPRMRSTTTG